MFLHTTATSTIIGPKFELSDFPELIKKHREKFPKTPNVEGLSEPLISADFSFPLMEGYIREVCRWGNFAGVGGRVIQNNTQSKIQSAFRNAYADLNKNPKNIAAALSKLNQLHSFGTPSFASKHLRFLRPDICPVYDSILSNRLPYSFNSQGYEEFAKDCLIIGKSLSAAKITNRTRTSGAWFAADVEAAIFARFYL